MLLKTITIICAAIASAVMGIAVDDYGDVGPCPEGDGLLALPEYDLLSMCWKPMYIMFVSEDSSDATCGTFIHLCPPGVPHVILDVTFYSLDKPFGSRRTYNLTQIGKGIILEQFWDDKGTKLEFKVYILQQYSDFLGGKIVTYLLCSDHSVQKDIKRRTISATRQNFVHANQVNLVNSKPSKKGMYAVPSENCPGWRPWGRWPPGSSGNPSKSSFAQDLQAS